MKSLRLLAWPLWTLLIFASLAAVRLLPGGFVRAALAAPILLAAPGSLTLGALFSQRQRPRGTMFVCYALLLGALWSAFASLALYVAGFMITAASTYWCLLAISAALAIAAEARLLLDRPGTGRRGLPRPEALEPDQPADEDDGAPPAVPDGIRLHPVIAAVAGVTLLAGGLYTYDRLPHPAPAGYTWMAWTSPTVTNVIDIGSAGSELSFQILHHQSHTTSFTLSAAWLGASSGTLAKPLTFSIGPDRTFHGALFVPPLPNGCTYRIVVSLTTAQQIDPLTRKPQTWSINADVQDPHKPAKACGG